MRFLLLVAALLAVRPAPAEAQLTVVGLRNLAFGAVIQGINSSVGPGDPVRSGQYEFTVPVGSRVRVQFTLPNRLNGPGGARMNIQFANNDAIALGQGPSSQPVTFNPRAPQTFNVVSSNRVWVFLGGTVTPANNQATGNYSNTVTLTITVL